MLVKQGKETSFPVLTDSRTRGSHNKLRFRRFILDIRKTYIGSTVAEGLPQG